jgi:hypothetical protein
VDQEVQQGKCEEVVIRARLSEKEKKGKWYIRNAATFKVSIIWQNIWALFIFLLILACCFKAACDYAEKTYTLFFIFMTLKVGTNEK